MTPTYPVYTPPSVTGITFVAGAGAAQPLPIDSLCTLADAKIVHAAMGGTLVNAADYPDLNYTFTGLDPTSPNQPWMIIGIGADGFVGPDVVEMYAKGIGHPGTWQKDATSGQWSFVFAPDPPPPAAPAPAPATGPTAAQLVYEMETAAGPNSTSGGGAALTTAQAQQLDHVEKMLEAELAADRIPDPGE